MHRGCTIHKAWFPGLATPSAPAVLLAQWIGVVFRILLSYCIRMPSSSSFLFRWFRWFRCWVELKMPLSSNG